MNTPQDSMLGREVAYPSHYAPDLLFPIPRAVARAEIGLDAATLPFTGHDRWHAYELSWLNRRGMPQVGTATLTVPAAAPNLIESKSLKLYLNSLNAERFDDEAAVYARIASDLSARSGAEVTVHPGLPPFATQAGALLDTLDLDVDDYGPPNPSHLSATAGDNANETLVSHLLKSNCPVTGQPDWGTVVLRYEGPRIDPAGLLRYLISFREHSGFHEQCVERIFADVLARCAPQRLSVEARYTRRGGLDINPWRITPGWDGGISLPTRELRQ
ncbi:NADPH-dependent 7-cyano-7-deazaguanine reductase QueF [Solimonas marina]|uniref:NADPH-dependent 7-cyano-7-deazaguanine reductase n=1 Tax=Solimonas marina TaxID=2714601 RepID=A0A970B817_9GAMM|nr:NADPH-dependent 7-cyano-7-deazaguanine reductase QueF [Solimonas marina]NKF24260.1 NADPH-dependent 7-cyano-7-deazaguanine reductase QueF [Solimonas marina]